MPSAEPITLEQFIADLDSLQQHASDAFAAATDADQLDQARVEFLGAKKGKFKQVQKSMGAVPKEGKRDAGQKLNAVKQAIQDGFDAAKARLGGGADGDAKRDETFDRTLPGKTFRVGKLHPITQTINELKDIMGRLGFTPADGPEIEDDWHNFEALNIPKVHPARDPLDNFYLSVASKTGANEAVPELNVDSPLLMRSQTSTVQIRVMENRKPPVRIVSLGRVYRPDTADWSHYPMFHQIEGLMIDEKVTLADLKTVIKLFASSYLGDDVPVRIRPSFFPFTEPSVEADYFWDGKWVEFGGAGMVDPNVLRHVGYDPDKVSGFAFGLGIERLCMIRHQITDIRYLFTNDVRFLRQF